MVVRVSAPTQATYRQLPSRALALSSLTVTLLVPATVALFGKYNWWLPAELAGLLRIEPSPPTPTLRCEPRGTAERA